MSIIIILETAQQGIHQAVVTAVMTQVAVHQAIMLATVYARMMQGLAQQTTVMDAVTIMMR